MLQYILYCRNRQPNVLVCTYIYTCMKLYQCLNSKGPLTKDLHARGTNLPPRVQPHETPLFVSHPSEALVFSSQDLLCLMVFELVFQKGFINKQK